MDTRRERWLAALLGALGTAGGVVAVEFVPRMMALDLVVRFPNVIWFFTMVLVVGAAGGRIGHTLFLHVAKGPIEGRAVVVGGMIGLAIAATSWSLTYFLRDALSPFEFNDAFAPLMMQALGESLLAGSLGGVLAALGIVKHLRFLSRGEVNWTREPLG